MATASFVSIEPELGALRRSALAQRVHVHAA
jgi:hypothetical protein